MTKIKKPIPVDRKLAAKILKIVDEGLSNGLGKPKPGEMCIEAAVCYAMGLPHGDEPPCVSAAVRALKIKLNDADWSSKTARAQGMRRLAIAQLGTAGVLDDVEFAQRVTLMTIQKIVPRALRVVASIHPEQSHKEALEKAALDCEKVKSLKAAADAAARAARAADAAARAAARAAAYAAAYAAARDKELSFFGEEVVKILIDMKAQGTQWLDLTEAA